MLAQRVQTHDGAQAHLLVELWLQCGIRNRHLLVVAQRLGVFGQQQGAHLVDRRLRTQLGHGARIEHGAREPAEDRQVQLVVLESEQEEQERRLAIGRPEVDPVVAAADDDERSCDALVVAGARVQERQSAFHGRR